MNLDLVLIYSLSGCLMVTISNLIIYFVDEKMERLCFSCDWGVYNHYFNVQRVIFWYGLFSWIDIESGFCKFFERFTTC